MVIEGMDLQPAGTEEMLWSGPGRVGAVDVGAGYRSITRVRGVARAELGAETTRVYLYIPSRQPGGRARQRTRRLGPGLPRVGMWSGDARIDGMPHDAQRARSSVIMLSQ